ncbi:MAG: MBL fold metallo-hydrolase [Chitinophagaceae bacterium]|nr:MBL fold metallo-hydrolase [Chitinophagaceae bacterium]
MKIAFHGAARCVTGSKHLLTLINGKKILLDCGMFQGMGQETDSLNRNWGFNPSDLTVVVLSHAHIDHSGLLPKLVKDGFKGKIYCTPATKELATVLMEDSAGIQEGDIRYVNKKRAAKGLPFLQPMYTTEDAIEAANQFVAIDYNTWQKIEEGVELQFTDAGHIIGSAAVHLRVQENGNTKKITFSGDVGRYRDIILKSPQTFEQSDVIIIESTYGNSLHDFHLAAPDLLLEWIEKTCITKKGKLIIPAFSVGRTQEILFALNQLELERRLPKLDYFVDSPLSIKATEIVKKYPKYFNQFIQKVLESDADPFAFEGLQYVQTREESKKINYRNEPCVIISSSGMAEAGRVKHHISNAIENSRNSILMSGYCEPHSLGGRLISGAKEVRIFGVEHEVHAEIGAIRSMSAHGDYDDLCQFLACQNPNLVEQLFLVHGEFDVQQDFKSRLIHKGFKNVVIPELHGEIKL